MKIVCISDTHGKHEFVDVPEGDMLIHAGDFSTWGKIEEAQKFLRWFNAHPHKYKILVAGNHDKQIERLGFGLFAEEYPKIVYLENSSIRLGGLLIWGSPYTQTFNNWSFMRDDEELDRFWQGIPENVDIVVTHGPALGVNDQSYPTMPHLGSATLAEKLKTRCPQLHVHGHIHGGYGVTEQNGIIHVNAAQVDEQYKPVNKPIVIEINPRP